MTLKRNMSILVITVIMLIAILMPITANAVNRPYAFTFNSVYGTQHTEQHTKSDSDQYWYVSVYNNGSNTLSSTNILGVKMHHLESIGYVSDYHLIKNYVSMQSYDYTVTVPHTSNDHFYMGAKKDDSSTSSNALIVSGQFCP